MKHDSKMRLVFFILVTLIALVIAFLSNGCEILKSNNSNKGDSTHVNKQFSSDTSSINAGTVKYDEKKSLEENEWWRIIKQFPKGDTITPITNVYPSTVIYEGGKGRKEESQQSYDSSFLQHFESRVMSKVDSISFKVEQISKQKSTNSTGIGYTTLILILAGYFILTKGAGFIFSKYTITKKNSNQ